MIYALSILNDKFVKIGFTSDKTTDSRISSLQTGSPFEIVELFTVEGTLRQEKELHKALFDGFARVRIAMPPNEWYPGRNEFFKEFLRYLRISPNFGLEFLDRYHQSVKQPGRGKTSVEPNIRWGTISEYKRRK